MPPRGTIQYVRSHQTSVGLALLLELLIFFNVFLKAGFILLQNGTNATLAVLLSIFRLLVIVSIFVVMVVEMSFEEAFLVLGVLLGGLLGV